MICNKCGHEIDPSFTFCPYCRVRIKRIRSGDVFGRLTVEEVLPIEPRWSGYGPVCKCICECGKTVNVEAALLRNGNTTSCGCRLKELQETAHVIDHIHFSIPGTKSDEAIDFMRNGKTYKNNTSGVMGVFYHKASGKWVAKANFCGKSYQFYFPDKESAIKKRKQLELDLWGSAGAENDL